MDTGNYRSRRNCRKKLLDSPWGQCQECCREHAAHHMALLPIKYRALFPKAVPTTKRQTKEFMKQKIHRTVRTGWERVMQISENTPYFTDKETEACRGYVTCMKITSLLKSQSKAFFTTTCFLSGGQICRMSRKN